MSLSDINPQIDPGSDARVSSSGTLNGTTNGTTNGATSIKDTAVNSKVRCNKPLARDYKLTIAVPSPMVCRTQSNTAPRCLKCSRCCQECANHARPRQRYSILQRSAELVLIHYRPRGYHSQERSQRYKQRILCACWCPSNPKPYRGQRYSSDP